MFVTEKTLIMGILNVTPDSFSDGGDFFSTEKAVEHAKQMILDGADVIDIGGESTRPGSDAVSQEEELERVGPVIQRLTEEKIEVPISIDTYKPLVADRCLKLGASMINDITGLGNKEMLRVVADHSVPVIVMHMKGAPKTMQKNPEYTDVVAEIIEFFKGRISEAQNAGIKDIILDPGIGFGKTTDHNLEILCRLREFTSLGFPILVGPSRKSFIGNVAGTDDAGQRLAGTLAALSIAIMNGASIIRVHDVGACKRAAQIADAIKNAQREKLD